MDKKDIPVLQYRGREITPAPVKMRVWRELLKEADAHVKEYKETHEGWL